MSQQESPWTSKHGFPLRSVLLVALIVGLGAGGVAYALATASAADTATTQTSQVNTNWPQFRSARGWPGPGYGYFNGSFTSFRAVSTVTNVTVTGFNIVDSTHFTVNLAYHGAGSAPAVRKT